MVFEYAEHDFLVSPSQSDHSQINHTTTFCTITMAPTHIHPTYTAPSARHADIQQIIHHHSQTVRTPIPTPTLRRLLHQLLCGVHYLHSNFCLHRDLKPANILVNSKGVVKIGDLGLARLWHRPLAVGGLFGGDKVVVTIWYRAPELILGAKHYTAAVGESPSLIAHIASRYMHMLITDLWAVGCIYAEMLSLRPIFKAEEAKIDTKKQLPFQRDQMGKICEILGPVKRAFTSPSLIYTFLPPSSVYL
jgi:cyclin-dependent kinase 8/11